MDNTRKIKIEWSIKGYHVLRIKPHKDVQLKVVPEYDNRFDRNAMKVLVPHIREIPHHLHSMEIRQGGNRGSLTVEDIAGMQIGRVPANLCGAFRAILSQQYATEITCRFTGVVGRSVNPAVNQRFRQATLFQEYDQPGGGAELQCIYNIKLKKDCFEQAMHIFENMVPRHELDARLFA